MSVQENFINKLIQQASSIGYQKSNRFIALIHGPGIDYLKNSDIGDRDKNELIKPLDLDSKKRLALSCVNATLPGRSVSTVEFGPIGSGPITKLPYARTFTNELSLTFNVSSDFFERRYLSGWLDRVISPVTNEVELYSSYAKPHAILIVMLPNNIASFDALDQPLGNAADTLYSAFGEGSGKNQLDKERPLFFVRLEECYPIEIQEEALSAESTTENHKVTVKFAYREAVDPITTYNRILSSRRDSERNEVLTQTGMDMGNPFNTITDFRPISGDFGNSGIVTRLDPPEIDGPVAEAKEKLSPFQQFKNIARDIARYADINELKQLAIDNGLEVLNQAFGVENVEAVAQAGQILDVYSKIEKTYRNTINRAVGPLGNILK